MSINVFTRKGNYRAQVTEKGHFANTDIYLSTSYLSCKLNTHTLIQERHRDNDNVSIDSVKSFLYLKNKNNL